MRQFSKAIVLGILSASLLLTACMDSKSTIEMYYDSGEEYKRAQLARLVILSEVELASLWQQHTKARFIKHARGAIFVEPCERLRRDVLWRLKEVELCSGVKDEFENIREQVIYQNTLSYCAYANDIKSAFSDSDSFISQYPNLMCRDNQAKYQELNGKVLSIVSKYDAITSSNVKAITAEEEIDNTRLQLNSSYLNNLKQLLSNQHNDLNYLDLDMRGQLKIQALTEKRYALSVHKNEFYIKQLEPDETLYRITPNDAILHAPNWLKDILNFDNDEVLDILNHAKTVW